MNNASDPSWSSKRRRISEDVEESKRLRVSDPATCNQTKAMTSALESLLDLSPCTDATSIEQRFHSIAGEILNRHYIKLSGENYEILELEFYLLMDEVHEDPFTHGSEEQKTSGKWYFHKAPRRSTSTSESRRSVASSVPSTTAAGGYRGGTRKGLDLTISCSSLTSPYFSDKSSTAANVKGRGGILLRSVKRVQDGKVISGPSLLVDHILATCGASNIASFVASIMHGELSAFKDSIVLCVVPRPQSEVGTETIYASPRIGLDLSHPSTKADPSNPRVKYISKPYRFFTSPYLLTKNGRPQTVLGVYQSLSPSQESAGSGTTIEKETMAEVARITGVKESSVEKYLADYVKGRNEGGARTTVLKKYVGVKGASASPGDWMRLMGMLASLGAES